MGKAGAAFKYRNTSDRDLVVMGVGEVKAGGTIDSDEPISNPNLELVTDGKKVKSEKSNK